MRYVLISLMLLVSSVFAQTAGEAEMAFNREYNEAKAVFDARVKAAQDKFVAVLKVEMKRLTQKGDLDGAVAIKEKIKGLESQEVNELKLKKIIGTKWKKNSTGDIIEFKVSGDLINSNKAYNGQYSITNNSITIIWGQNETVTVTFVDDLTI